MPNSNWWQAWGVWIAIFVSLLIGLVGFAYNDGERSSAFSALEARLHRDELEFEKGVREIRTDLDRAKETHRIEVTQLLDENRNFEVETNSRLSAIDVKLKEIEINQQHIQAGLLKIEGYIMEIQDEITDRP